jgi:hypothetical protein
LGSSRNRVGDNENKCLFSPVNQAFLRARARARPETHILPTRNRKEPKFKSHSDFE